MSLVTPSPTPERTKKLIKDATPTTPQAKIKRNATPRATPDLISLCLNTPAREVRPVRGQTTFHLQQTSTRKLRALDTLECKTEGLELFMVGIRQIVAQQWKSMLVYFDPEHELPHEERRWSYVEWTKWHLIAFLTHIATEYGEACQKAEEDGVPLCADKIDQEFLLLVHDVLCLGIVAERGSVIEIKEWERLGTMESLSVDGVSATDE